MTLTQDVPLHNNAPASRLILSLLNAQKNAGATAEAERHAEK